MPSLMRSSSSAVSAGSSASASSPAIGGGGAFGSVAAQAAAVNAFRARLMSPASSVADTEEELDLSTASLPPLAPTAAAAAAANHAAHERHRHACTSCSDLETEFAAAVLFVETYNGPHRILTQENSSPKKDFYAFYQQATVGPCLATTPPPGLNKTELSKWEKWRNLGSMTRHEAMKRYTTALDNLVDDWRRSANVRTPALFRTASGSSSTAGDASSPSALGAAVTPRRSTNMFERLPRIYDELGELQDRVEDETKKREELEAHLLNFTREYRAMITREMEQVDQMRSHLTALVRTLEDDVTSHHSELQAVAARQAAVERSALLALEQRARRAGAVVRAWLRHPLLLRALLVLAAVRVWRAVRARRLPQLAAQLLIRWLAAVSSLDAPPPSRALLRG